MFRALDLTMNDVSSDMGDILKRSAYLGNLSVKAASVEEANSAAFLKLECLEVLVVRMSAREYSRTGRTQ